MQAKNDVVLLTQDRNTARTIVDTLENIPEIAVRLDLKQSLSDLEASLEENSVPVALVDVEPAPMEGLREIEVVVRRFPTTRFVILCEEFRNDVVLEAMQIGARHCLVKSSIARDLPGALRRLTLDAASASGTSGTLVTVLSVRGGCGATTLAINMAEEVRLQSKEPVLLVDLDCDYGSVATFLGLKGEYGIADVLSHPMALDPHLVSSTATHYTDDFHILMSPASVSFSKPAPVDFDQLQQTLTACRRAYPFTIIDAPRVSMETAAVLAKASSVTFLVLELDVVAVRTANNMLMALADRRVPLDKLVTVANRYKKRSPLLSLAAAQEALTGTTLKQVRNDFESAARSINFGQPLAQAAPRSRIRKDLRSLLADALAPPASEDRS